METVLPSGLILVSDPERHPSRAIVPGSHLIDVHLYRPSTGDRRVYRPEYPWVEDGEGNPGFIWDEGNYGCDCNRSLFLYNWEREPMECGNTIVIEKIVIRYTDTVLYSEPVPDHAAV